MIIVLSPSKTLDYSSPIATDKYSIPEFIKESSELIKILRKKTPSEIMRLMSISTKLAELNHRRYLEFHIPLSPQNARQAIFAFKGDVYDGIETSSYGNEELNFTQKHLRILSGLYGLLKPLDLIQPYRLEMGISLENPKGKNLYEFWGSKITDSLNIELQKQKNPMLINLASQEYSKSIKVNMLKSRLVNINFKEKTEKDLKTIGLFAKRARGEMTNFIIKGQIEKLDDIKQFSAGGYRFSIKLSDEENYIFIRERRG